MVLGTKRWWCFHPIFCINLCVGVCAYAHLLIKLNSKIDWSRSTTYRFFDVSILLVFFFFFPPTQVCAHIMQRKRTFVTIWLDQSVKCTTRIHGQFIIVRQRATKRLWQQQQQKHLNFISRLFFPPQNSDVIRFYSFGSNTPNSPLRRSIYPATTNNTTIALLHLFIFVCTQIKQIWWEIGWVTKRSDFVTLLRTCQVDLLLKNTTYQSHCDWTCLLTFCWHVNIYLFGRTKIGINSSPSFSLFGFVFEVLFLQCRRVFETCTLNKQMCNIASKRKVGRQREREWRMQRAFRCQCS